MRIPTIQNLKKTAKRNKKKSGNTLSYEQQLLAKKYGYSSWESLLANRHSFIYHFDQVPLVPSDETNEYSLAQVSLSPHLRNVGSLIGPSGSGKSVLAANMVEKALESGYDVTVLSPDGGYINSKQRQQSYIERLQSYSDCRDMSYGIWARLQNQYPGNLQIIEDVEPTLTSHQSNPIETRLLVIEDGTALLSDDFVQVICNEANAGGQVLVLEQHQFDASRLTNHITKEHIGFLCINRQGIKRCHDLSLPSNLTSNEHSLNRDWIILSNKGNKAMMGIGSDREITKSELVHSLIK
ncbi:hypothetical protein J4N45_09865 [Vibrio sp. SCSIO 43140]|uniref:ATP-binding protein n=1 Tax=Vibrio sp. SCSIO 43140 TaxID=2819100 RepID=UPI0020755839|nr:hypothetical protein [Vibrio sp. SCSIO 43140]USD58834.1 hypothetical protein J4N45_09865 [Vibrio sp. SCSIO 43140]